jgi:hypothetical protein
MRRSPISVRASRLPTQWHETSEHGARKVQHLTRRIKELVAKGDAACDGAEKCFKQAGAYLKELKQCKPTHLTWELFVRDTCDLGRSRADELIALAEGRTTLGKVRAATATRAKRHRQRHAPPLRNGGSSRLAPVGGAEGQPQHAAAGDDLVESEDERRLNITTKLIDTLRWLDENARDAKALVARFDHESASAHSSWQVTSTTLRSVANVLLTLADEWDGPCKIRAMGDTASYECSDK